MAQYVLVPGAWLGGWAWRKVRTRLQAAGHDVTTPTLTGLGERSHLARREVDLGTHIDDVVNAIVWDGLDEVVLVGHSLGGLVVAGVADRIPDRIRQVVYVGSSVPEDGRSLFDAAGRDYRAFVQARADEAGDGWRWPLPPPDELATYLPIDDMREEDRRWFWAHAVPQPLRTMDQPLSLTVATTALPVTWVQNELDGPLPDLPAAWTVRTLPTGHWPMVTMPDELADILREAAEASAARYGLLAAVS